MAPGASLASLPLQGATPGLLSASIGQEASDPLWHQKTSPRMVLAIVDRIY